MNKRCLWFTVIAAVVLLIAVIVRISGNPELAWFILGCSSIPAILAAWR